MSGTIRPDTIAVSSSTPILNTKSLPAPASSSKPSGKPVVTAPRIDVEPLYTALKSAIGDAGWAEYKAAVSEFMLGNLNQEELTRRLSPILTTPSLEHSHNQFIFAIYTNTFRDPPEPGVASWVSANDKPSNITKPAGDEAEKRLKHEVMQLARRERKRLKTIQENPYDAFTQEMMDYHSARTIKLPDVGPASAGGFQKTNWDLEIRKRYTQPLFTETHEFPDTDTIAARMTPICYENGLPGGSHPDCAAYVNIATETYIKEALSKFFSHVNSNGDRYIRTAEFKKRLERDEERVARGEIQKSAAGLLPCEIDEMRARKPLGGEDIRLALELGDSYLGQVPLIAGAIADSRRRYLEDDLPDTEDEGPVRTVAAVVNGLAANVKAVQNGPANGVFNDLPEPVVLDEEWGWRGGQVGDVEGLDGVLDGCLSLGL